MTIGYIDFEFTREGNGINFDYVLAKKRLSRANTMILWKNAVLDNTHLHIPYDIFVRVLYAHIHININNYQYQMT